jgi:hypothetical protein
MTNTAPTLDLETLRTTPPCATGKKIIARHIQMNDDFDRSFFKDNLLAHALGAHGTRPPSPDFAEIHCLKCYLALEAIVTKWVIEARDSCHAKLLSGSRDALNDVEDALWHLSFLRNIAKVRERSLL